jgi:hypothetical protein
MLLCGKRPLRPSCVSTAARVRCSVVSVRLATKAVWRRARDQGEGAHRTPGARYSCFARRSAPPAGARAWARRNFKKMSTETVLCAINSGTRVWRPPTFLRDPGPCSRRPVVAGGAESCIGGSTSDGKSGSFFQWTRRHRVESFEVHNLQLASAVRELYVFWAARSTTASIDWTQSKHIVTAASTPSVTTWKTDF